MQTNHRWEREYFPLSHANDFLYFRQNGLFAEDWEDFQVMVKGIMTEPVEYFQVAVRNETITEENIQFIYDIRDDLDAIFWSEQVWQDIHVHSIEPAYLS